MTLKLSKIWKDRFLDFIRIISIILCFYSIWLAIDGDTDKYNIPVIIACFQGVNIFLWILYGEAMRMQDAKIEWFEDKYKEIKNR